MVSAQTTVVYFHDGKHEIGRFGSQNRINVNLDQVPDFVQKEVIAAEDRSFYRNKGISPTGIARAFWNNLRTGSTQGGSTITQQYAKNAYLSQERTYTRKLKEFFIAVKLARAMTRTRSCRTISTRSTSAAARTASRRPRRPTSARTSASSPSPRVPCWPR
jgi:membrane peptidoglycan carboxypeptidase